MKVFYIRKKHLSTLLGNTQNNHKQKTQPANK